ncbi:uncharacterized protein [Spinacia oleracea]|uniref:Uncharacterized protein n=1 Tax=Spinacia oleracea TaxID=3562 RepID=A0ABM3QRL5_SPIOL|nr:uncharacterized protein LOC110791136 [Spinacia oleracea]
MVGFVFVGGVQCCGLRGDGATRTTLSPRRRKNVASRPRVPREDFDDDSSSSSDEEFAKNLPPMVRGKEDVNLFPSDIFPSMKWLRYLREQGRDFERFLLLPPGSAMDRLSPEDKGVVEVPAWLSEVYTEDILKAVEAKKKDSSKKSSEDASGDVAKEPILPATKKRPASSTEAPKPKRPFFKKMGPADAVTEMDGSAGAATDEATVDQTAAADAPALSREDKGKGKETEAPSTDNASTPLAASPIG